MATDAARSSRACLATLLGDIDALGRMTVSELRRKYADVFGEATRSRNKTYLTNRIQYGLQEMARGRTLSERAHARIEELTAKAPVRYRRESASSADTTREQRTTDARNVGKPIGSHTRRDPRLPPPGTRITREYGGTCHEVIILERDVSYEGRRYRSLSGVAHAITGQARNGFRFFGLDGGGSS